MKTTTKQNKEKRRVRNRPGLKKQLEFAERTLGIWADNPEIDKAFEELEDEWRQWDKEILSQFKEGELGE